MHSRILYINIVIAVILLLVVTFQTERAETEKTPGPLDCRFGFTYNSHFLCEPVYSGPKVQDYFDLARKLGIDYDNYEDYFMPFPDGSLNGFIASRPGDTVVILYSGGPLRAIVEDIGMYSDACHTDWMCRLKALREVDDFPKWNITYLVSSDMSPAEKG